MPSFFYFHDFEKAGEYVYTVRETKGNDTTITYDDTVYTVKALVVDNLDGTFSVTYTYLKGVATANGVIFVNVYTAPPVPTPESKPEPEIPTVQTGDAIQYGLLAALLFVSGGGVLLATKKKRDNENA